MKAVQFISKIFLFLVGGVIALFLLALIGLHIAKYFMYSDYYKDRETVSKIPALNEGFVPQGLDYDEKTDTYIHSGYNASANGCTEIYFVKGKDVKKLIPVTESGERIEGHAGGVTRVGDYLYVSDNANEKEGKYGILYIYDFNALQQAKDGDGIKAIGTFNLDTAGSFCFSDGQYIYAGEFYRPVDYETKETHYFTTPAGDENKAILSAYPVDEKGNIVGEYPEFSVSIPAQVQGFAKMPDGKVAFSTSWGLNASHLEIHSEMKDSGKTIGVSGKEVPLYYVDSTTRIKDVSMPAFSEGLSIKDGKIVISFESACNKYIIGKLFFATKVVSYPVN